MSHPTDAAARVPAGTAQELAVDAARARIAQWLPLPTGTERLPLQAALGRVICKDIISPINVPAHDNSAMDGYALRGSELVPDQQVCLRIAGKALAGLPFAAQTPQGMCVRIMTGAVMPAGLDTVVPQELVRLGDDGTVSLPANTVKAGDNVRRAGEDLRRGSPALSAGQCLRPADLGLIASLGVGEVDVFRPLRVAFFSTGSELRSIGEPLDEGCVYDSNRYTVGGMLQRLGCTVIDLGRVSDDPDSLEAALRQASDSADAVITTGGVSVGEADHTRTVLSRLGEIEFWNLAMRPGRPMACGRLSNAGRPVMLFGLPGNPVAAMVTFYVLVRDALLVMSGARPRPLPTLQVISAHPIRKRPGRTEFQRGIVSQDTNGRWQVALTGAQGSGILSSMSLANGLIVLPPDSGSVAAGQAVDVLLFDGLA